MSYINVSVDRLNRIINDISASLSENYDSVLSNIKFSLENLRDGGEKGKWCELCGFSRKIRDPNAYLDPVEGYKMANYYDCPLCKKRGII